VPCLVGATGAIADEATTFALSGKPGVAEANPIPPAVRVALKVALVGGGCLWAGQSDSIHPRVLLYMGGAVWGTAAVFNMRFAWR